VPEPTNPRKRSLMPSGALRRALRAAGHHLEPVVQVGKEGVTEAVVAALDEQLTVHELVKVKVGGESPEDRFEAAGRLGVGAGAAVAQILGRTVLLYRRHPERPRYEPEKAPPRPAPEPPAGRRTRTRKAPRGRGMDGQRGAGKRGRPRGR
jgi:RNA-binding protein